MNPIEVMARAICKASGYEPDELDLDTLPETESPDGWENWMGFQGESRAALLALSQIEPTPGMVEAGINAAEVDHNDLDLAMANAFRAMLAAALAEKREGV